MSFQDVALVPFRASFYTLHKIAAEVKDSGPPHVIKMRFGVSKSCNLLGVSKGMLPFGCKQELLPVGCKQGHATFWV